MKRHDAFSCRSSPKDTKMIDGSVNREDDNSQSLPFVFRESSIDDVCRAWPSVSMGQGKLTLFDGALHNLIDSM